MHRKLITISSGKTNCYLIQADEGYLLIDTGYEKDYIKFLRELDKNEIKVSEVNYLLLTHHHDDHAGFVNKILKDSELIIIAHEKAKELLKSGENDTTRGGGIINKRMYYLFKFGQKYISNLFELTFPPVSLRDKDILIKGNNENVLKEIGVNAEIIYTPGHSIDSISVLFDREIIFCGDAAMSWPLWAGIKYHTIFITDVDEYYRSWEKIIESGAQKVYPSHGKPFNVNKLKENKGEFNNDDLIMFF